MLWELGYVNLVMLMATVPVYDADDKDGKPQEETVDFGDDVQSLANFLNNIK